MNYLRFLAAFFILSVCFSCKTKEVVKPNSPPSAFTVTATLDDNGKDIILKWTKSKDPDGDAVTYAVVYKDTLAKNLSDTTYIIKDIPYGTEVKGSVMAKDSKGGIINSLFSTKTNEDPYVKIPDINFEKALILLKIDNIQDGKLLKSSAEKVTKLDFSMFNIPLYISTLIGIEAFKNLKYLDITGFFDLTNFDISQNTNLVELRFSGNKMTSLDVSQNIALETLQCVNTKITSLDISKNTALITLECQVNQLTNLDISKNLALITLNCERNQLLNLDVTKNPNLKTLNCSDNKLKDLNVNTNINLIEFYCSDNLLSSLDISKNAALISLRCQNNQIQTICIKNLSQVYVDWRKDDFATYKICN